MTERLATAAARHPGLTIWAWIAAVVLSIVLVVFFLGDALSGEAGAVVVDHMVAMPDGGVAPGSRSSPQT